MKHGRFQPDPIRGRGVLQLGGKVFKLRVFGLARADFGTLVQRPIPKLLKLSGLLLNAYSGPLAAIA